MQPLKDFKRHNINWFNNLSSYIDHDSTIDEMQLVKEHGKDLDSIMHKIDVCSQRSIAFSSGGMLLESQDDLFFTIEEQYATRDLFILMCKEWLDEVVNEYGLEVPILESDQKTSGIKNYLAKIQAAAKEKAAKFKDGLHNLGEKLKAVKEFIQGILSKTIKTAKEAIMKFIELMISIGQKLGDLFKKLGGNVETIEVEMSDKMKKALESGKVDVEEKITYESLQKQLLADDQIVEFKLFGRNKDKDSDNSSGSEYSQSINKKKENTGEGGGRRKIILSILKNVALSVTLTIIIPAIICCLPPPLGPAAAMIAATIGKAIMTGISIWKLVKDISKTVKSAEWKELKPIKKLGRVLMWIIGLALIAWGAASLLKQVGQIFQALSNGSLQQLIPDSAIQGCSKIINNIAKKFTGHDTPGFEQMQNILNNGVEQISEVVEETAENTKDALKDTQPSKLSPEDLKSVQDKISELEKGVPASEWNQAMKDGFDKIKDNLPQDKRWFSLNCRYKGGLNNLFKTDVGKEWFSKYGEEFGEYIKAQSSNSIGKTYGSIIGLPASMGEEAVRGFQNVLDAAGATGAMTEIGTTVAKEVATTAATVTTTTALPAIVGGFAPIVPIPSLAKKKVKKGFLLRLGSSRSGNTIYAIEEDGIKGMKFVDIKNNYNDLNPQAIGEMEKIVKSNYEELKKAKEKLESKDNLDKKQKQQLDAMTKQLDKQKEGADEYECIVFFSNIAVEPQKEDKSTTNTNEGLKDLFNKGDKPEKKKLENKPVMFINPLCMACADLANRTKSKKPRVHPIYFKGMFASYEFLPGAEGMSEKDINEMLKDIILESVKTAWNMTSDAPCIKDGKKFVENTESPNKGKKRPDFGNFKNDEITEIFNDPSAITKYMSGAHSERSTVEKEDTKFQKQRKQKAKEEWKHYIENNDEVKKIIKNSRTLRKNLLDKDGHVIDSELDKLSDTFLRMETSYGKDQSRKSLWKRIKNIFTKDDKIADKYDAKDMQTLAYKLAELHKKKIDSRVKESQDIEDLELVDEALKNFKMHLDDIMSEEFIEFLMTDEIYEENVIREFELLSE